MDFEEGHVGHRRLCPGRCQARSFARVGLSPPSALARYRCLLPARTDAHSDRSSLSLRLGATGDWRLLGSGQRQTGSPRVRADSASGGRQLVRLVGSHWLARRLAGVRLLQQRTPEGGLRPVLARPELRVERRVQRRGFRWIYSLISCNLQYSKLYHISGFHRARHFFVTTGIHTAFVDLTKIGAQNVR